MEYHDPLQPHSHEPNPKPPSPNPDFELLLQFEEKMLLTVDWLLALPQSQVERGYIVSTGHGTSGPFVFQGAAVRDVLKAIPNLEPGWSQVEVVGADGFGTRLWRQEIEEGNPAGSILFCYALNGQIMTRDQGLVRLIVPGEKDDALRQVKWIGKVQVRW